MTRYLAIDPGDKRTGLAVGDDATGQAGPAGVIEAAEPRGLLQGIRDAIEEYRPDALVIGVPYNMDGGEGPAARKSLALAALLELNTGLSVHRADERLTSYAADDAMRLTGLTHRQKKSRRDALAAAVILRDFLNQKKRTTDEQG